jgi:hypothetical protein
MKDTGRTELGKMSGEPAHAFFMRDTADVLPSIRS